MAAERRTEARRGSRLQYLTVAWNLMEFAVTVALGIGAGSVALVAFGLDSLVEVFASAVVLWHLGAADDGEASRRTGRALRLVAGAFAVLAVGLAVGAARSWSVGARPEPSPVGIAYLAVTAVVMLTLARMKRLTGTALNSDPLLREAAMTRIDGWLATGVLGALAANLLFSWWWADALAGATVALLALREARLTWLEASETSVGAGR